MFVEQRSKLILKAHFPMMDFLIDDVIKNEVLRVSTNREDTTLDLVRPLSGKRGHPIGVRPRATPNKLSSLGRAGGILAA